MIRQISSKLTFLHKLLPLVFVLSLINLGIMYATGRWHDTSLWLVAMVAVTIAFVAWSVYMFLPPKKVQLDDNFLYVSDFRNEARIGISEIERVTEFPLSKPRRVTIHVKSETIFGRKIVFLATCQVFGSFSSHPIVAELRSLAAARS